MGGRHAGTGDPMLLGIIPRDRIRMIEIRRPPTDLIARFQELSDLTGLVSRALDRLGVAGAIPGYLLPPIAKGQRVVGPAITVRNVPDRFVPYRKWQRRDATLMGEGEAYFVASRGDVIVIDGGGRMDASNFGAHSARTARDRGCLGTVVDGPVTGVAGIAASGYPVWARGATTISGNHRVETIEINGVVSCGGVQVEPGDLIAADDQGIVVVPLELVTDAWRICAEQARVAREFDTPRGAPSARRMRRFLQRVSVRP